MAKSCTSKKVYIQLKYRFRSAAGITNLAKGYSLDPCSLASGVGSSSLSLSVSLPPSSIAFECLQTESVLSNLPQPSPLLIAGPGTHSQQILSNYNYSAITNTHSGQLPWLFLEDLGWRQGLPQSRLCDKPEGAWASTLAFLTVVKRTNPTG